MQSFFDSMRLLLLDNYDSFTYNLLQLIEQSGCIDYDVIKNDQIVIETLVNYTHIVLSPGPGVPEEAGLLKEVVRLASGKVPILGICLGHQAIAEVFGSILIKSSEIVHGKASSLRILDPENYIFNGISLPFLAGRYHSWVVDKARLGPEVIVTCEDDKGAVMGLRHLKYDVQGLQFHPESIMTPQGARLITNWIYARR